MLFTVTDLRPPSGSPPHTAYLVRDEWDDWFKFETSFSLYVIDDAGERHSVGGVKIGEQGLVGLGRTAERQQGYRYPSIPNEFDALDEQFFSLGQDENYYETLNGLKESLKLEILIGLRDAAFNLNIFEKFKGEDVMTTSLLRGVRSSNVAGRLHRLASGDARLTEFHFSYTLPANKDVAEQPTLAFDVYPEAQPPTNVHALIGRNGAGKSRFIRGLSQALLGRDNTDGSVGLVELTGDGLEDWSFAGLVLVSFSAFDNFILEPKEADELPATYVGLRETMRTVKADESTATKTPEELAHDFAASLRKCRTGLRAGRWRQAILTLEADDLFAEANVASLLEEDEDDWYEAAGRTFLLLSSGHAIVLLTITKLVELVDERTLVLLDEPEAHLHPPLLSAFVRSLSDLLVSRNGVAIVATHSPVVLQEVPRACTWKIRRAGGETWIDRPEGETFAENVSVLTREVFGLEITKSGFHRLIEEAVRDPFLDYADVLSRFEGQLGAEGKALARGLISERDRER